MSVIHYKFILVFLDKSKLICKIPILSFLLLQYHTKGVESNFKFVDWIINELKYIYTYDK